MAIAIKATRTIAKQEGRVHHSQGGRTRGKLMRTRMRKKMRRIKGMKTIAMKVMMASGTRHFSICVKFVISIVH
jgi:hypothetical protein